MTASPSAPRGQVSPSDLAEMRLQLHHAAQLPAAFGRSFAEPLPDDAHANLEWSPAHATLTSRRSAGPGVSLALRVPDLSLLLVDGRGAPAAELPCDGRPLRELLRELRLRIELLDVELDPARLVLEMPYFLPDHDVMGGAPFQLDEAAASELAGWFSLAHPLLAPLAARPGAAPLRCGPHQFELATLLPVGELPPDGADEPPARTVGVGLSPGDETSEAPYLYVTPWPTPARAEVPQLQDGASWTTEGWVGALLPAEGMLACGDPAAAMERFLAVAVPAATRLAESAPLPGEEG